MYSRYSGLAEARLRPADRIERRPIRQQHLTITYRRVEELKPDSANPRRHSRKQLKQIAESIKLFDFIVPVLTDRDGKIGAGHGRTEAANALGMTEVPTICLEHLSPAQIRAFMIADNKLTENAIWDDRLLAEQLRDLSMLGLDFSLEITGFEIGEIDLRIASESLAPCDDPAGVLPEALARPLVSQLGDLWLLGHHRLLCGCALDTGAFTALMGEERAAAIFTDPLYNVQIDGHASGLGAVHHRPFPMASGEMSKAEFTAFLACALCDPVAFSTAGSLHYISMDWCHLEKFWPPAARPMVSSRISASGPSTMQGLARSTAVSTSSFLSSSNASTVHRNNIPLGQFGRNRSNVWHYPGANSFARCSEESNLLALHPTVKPVTLDAMLMFFGDPETKGVEEDVRTCARRAQCSRGSRRRSGGIRAYRTMGKCATRHVPVSI